eukprot:gene11266-2460_t
MSPWAHMGWSPERGTYVRLVNLETGESSIWPLERNVYSVHHVNGYVDEKTNTVVIDTHDYMNPDGPP